VQRSAGGAQAVEALGMADAGARCHPVHLSRYDDLLDPQAVAVGDLALKQIGHGGEADMGVRAHIGIARHMRRQIERTHMVEKNKGTDHAALGERQHAADLQRAQAAPPRFDHHVEHVSLLVADQLIMGRV
jgi:hypothetical protein